MLILDERKHEIVSVTPLAYKNMRDVRQNILNDQIQTAKAIENLVRSLITEQENILKDAYENYKQLNQQSSNNEDLEPMLEKLDIARVIDKHNF